MAISLTVLFLSSTLHLTDCTGAYRFEGEYVGMIDVTCATSETTKATRDDIPTAGIEAIINGVSLVDCHLSNIRQSNGPVEVVLHCP